MLSLSAFKFLQFFSNCLITISYWHNISPRWTKLFITSLFTGMSSHTIVRLRVPKLKMHLGAILMHRFLFLKRNTTVFLLLFIAHCADNRRLPRRHAWTFELRSLTSSEHEQHQLLAVSQRKLMQQNQERLKPNHILSALYLLTICRCETVRKKKSPTRLKRGEK